MLRGIVTVGRLVTFASVAAAMILVAGCQEEIVYTSEVPWEDDTVLPTMGDGKILVTNSYSDTISWIDIDAREVVYTQPVGRLAPERESPHHGAVSPDGSAIFVGISNYLATGGGTGPHGAHGTGNVPGWLLKYDAYTHELIGQSLVENNPGDVRVTPDGRFVIQSHFDALKIQQFLDEVPGVDTPNSSLAIVDARAMGEPDLVEVKSADHDCGAGHGIAISDDSKFAFVACSSGDVIAKVDLVATTHPIATFPVGAAPSVLTSPTYSPYAIAIGPKGSPIAGQLWVSSTESQDLRVLDLDAEPDASGLRLVGAPIAMETGSPFFGDFTSDGATFIVAVQGQDTLEYIDTATHTRTSQALPKGACERPHGVLVLPDDETLLIVCEGNHRDPGTVVFVDIANKAVSSYIDVGVFPDDLIALLPRATP